MTDQDDDGPLAGVRVLDVSQLLPGPWAAQVLADLGADVTKVEPPGGDGGRAIRGDVFTVSNRNKRGVVLDLKSDEGRSAFLDLARDADVLVEGYRPGVVDRLGIGYDQVSAVNPRIVYCSITGFGQGKGPDRQTPGHDLNYLAASGALSFPGHWGEDARRPGVPMADLASSSFAVVAILAALHDRDRRGRGCHLDVSMTDVMTAWASARGGSRLVREADDRRHLYPTNDVFSTADGQRLALGAVEDGFWEATRQALAEVEPRLADERFADRKRYPDEVHRLVRDAFAELTLAEWRDRLAGTNVPVTPVRSLTEVADAAVAAGDELVQEKDGERHVVFPVRRDGAVMGRLRSASPALDGDGRNVSWTSR